MPPETRKKWIHLKTYDLVARWVNEAKVAVAFSDSDDTASTLEESRH
jgi:hypothetical protein